jgi:histidine triad (HIT) family protein
MAQRPSDPACIFCKIVAGQIPCWRLYDDESVLAFLDIGPLSEGHCLIIPKSHYVTIDEMSAEESAACARLIPALSRAVKDATGAPGWNVLQNNGAFSGQAVSHVHFHIIPRREGDGLGYRWPAGKLDASTAERLQAQITQRLR